MPSQFLGEGDQGQHRLVRMTTGIANIGLEMTALANDFRSAETAACRRFKRKAEERHNERFSVADRVFHSTGALTTDNAQWFFDYFQERRPATRVRVENEAVVQAGSGFNKASITVNDEPIGQTVTVSSKKKA